MNISFLRARRENHRLQLLHIELEKVARKGDIDGVRILLNQGADPNGGHPFRHAPIAAAIGSGKIEVVQLFLERGADPNYVAAATFCPLNWAIGQGTPEMVRLLIEKGADVNQPGISYKPLMIASAFGQPEVVLHLLQCGADIHIQEENGMTALTYALMAGSEEVARLLQERGAVVTVLDAIVLQDMPLYQQLRETVETGAARCPTRWGGFLMDEAIYQGDLAQVRLLLDAGVSPMVNNNTTLTQATIHNKGKIVRLLLERGADPNQRIPSGGRAMKFARQRRNRAIIEILKQYGARW
jgi:ankyrin repeat protein